MEPSALVTFPCTSHFPLFRSANCQSPNANSTAAAGAFVELIVKEADNNVKLIVLDRFDALRAKHEGVLDTMVMDILKVLNSQDMEVKRKAIGIALEMVTSRNVEDVVLFLKKQLQGTMASEFDKVCCCSRGHLRSAWYPRRGKGDGLALIVLRRVRRHGFRRQTGHNGTAKGQLGKQQAASLMFRHNRGRAGVPGTRQS